MYKTISIIIPYFKESPGVLFPLLSSINNQVGIDWEKVECIMVNDGADNSLPDDFYGLFTNLDIKIIMCKINGGPGVARQVGIDEAHGEYVMFCDADDVIHNVAVLGVFFDEFTRQKPDVIMTPWVEELIENGKYIYITHSDEATWMHGKIFRRQYLIDNNIRFQDELRVHEDSYFLALAFAFTDKIVKIPITSYIWKYHTNSITRINNAEYTFKSMPEYIKAIETSYVEIERRAPMLMEYKIIQFITYVYFVTQKPEWQASENQTYLNILEIAFRKMIYRFTHYFREALQEKINEIYSQERIRLFNGCMETELFKDWVARMLGVAE